MNKSKTLIVILGVIGIASFGNQKEKNKADLAMLGNFEHQKMNVLNNNIPMTDADEVDVVEIKITGNDQMQFDTKEIKVKAGQTIKLTLVHIGELSEKVMGHNFVLLEQKTDIAKFAQRAAAARENGYLPEDAEEVIVNTEMIGGGESTTIEFEAPAAGTYSFICSFPGHFVQMQGEFIVE